MSGDTYLVLGGAGLVGYQVCRIVAREFDPKRIVVASLQHAESEAACDALRKEFPGVGLVAESGNLFVPRSLANVGRNEIRNSAEHRAGILDHIFGDFDTAYRENTLSQMILKHSL